MPFGSKSNGGSNAKDAGSSFPWKKKKEPEPAKPSFFTAKTSGQNGTEVEASPAFSWGKKQQEETVAPTAPAPARSFPWSKKKQETVAVVQPPAPPPQPTQPVAPATPPRSSKFSFKKNSTKGSNKGSPSKSVVTAPPTPSPPRQSSKRVEEQYNEKRKRSCCSCKCLIGSSCLLILIAIGGVLAWRYGPWMNSATSTNLRVQSCPDCCNGMKSNCKLPLNRVLFPTLHNAHASKDYSFITPNHEKQFEDALVAGYRGLQFSTCTCESILSNSLLQRDPALGLEESNLGFCNVACGAGVRDPKAVIENLKTFLDVNRRELLIVDIEMNNDSEDDLRTALRASGLLDYVYIPDSRYFEWPTMGKLIDKNKRLILFARGGTMRSCPPDECRDGILYFYDFFAQTEPDGSDVSSCDATLSGEINIDFMLMNQFQNNAAKIPSAQMAKDLNSYNALSARFDDCKGKIEPSMLSVDFWQTGNVLEFAQRENEKREELMKQGFGKRGLRG